MSVKWYKAKEREYNMVLFYKINCQTTTTKSGSGGRGEDTPLQRTSFPKDFKDHWIQPPFDFPMYSISSKWLFILNQNKKGIRGVKKKASSL